LSNTFTAPVWVKADPHGSKELQIGDSDPLARTDVINRTPKGIYANFRRLINTIMDGVTADFTDLSTATAYLPTGLINPIYAVNNTGGSLVAGDVVALAAASSEASVKVTLNDSLSDELVIYVVALESINNGSSGRFAGPGSVVSAKTSGSDSGRWLVKSATTKTLEPATSILTAPRWPAGSCALALTTESGGFSTVLTIPTVQLGHNENAQWTVDQEFVGSNGQRLGLKRLTELKALGSGTSTFTTTMEIPTSAVVMAVSTRVTVALPGVTTYDVGVSGATTRYGSGFSSAANTTSPGTNDATRYYAAAVPITITTNVNTTGSTGRIRVTIWYYDSTPPTS